MKVLILNKINCVIERYNNMNVYSIFGDKVRNEIYTFSLKFNDNN